jgi:uncharacterized protein with PQ loop repeat
MSAAAVLGLAAGGWGILMGLSPALQIKRIIERRHSDDVSMPFLAIIAIGTALWTSYGVAVGDPVIIIGNFFGVVGNLTALAVVYRYRTR